MWIFFSEILKLWKGFSKDIFFVYKNIFHWNISKAFMWVSIIINVLLFWVFFAWIMYAIIVLSSGSMDAFSAWVNNALDPFSSEFLHFDLMSIIIFLLLIIAMVIWVGAFLYIRVLFAKLNLAYVWWEKLQFKKNKYFQYNLFYKHICLTLLAALIMFAPMIIWAILIAVLTLFIQVDSAHIFESVTESKLLQLLSFMIMLVTSILTIYLWYRMSFVHLLLVEQWNEKVLKIIQHTFSITRSKVVFLQFVIYCIPLFIILGIWTGFYNWMNKQYDEFNTFIQYENIKKKEWEWFNLDSEEFFDYQRLKTIYWEMSHEELKNEYEYVKMISRIFYLINFVFFFGLFELLITGFYKRKLVINKNLIWE